MVSGDDTVARFHFSVICPNYQTSFNSLGALIHHLLNRLRSQYRDGDLSKTIMMGSSDQHVCSKTLSRKVLKDKYRTPGIRLVTRELSSKV
jgi:hypothetical protein